MISNRSKGIYFALLTTLISGFSIFLNKYAVGVVTPPLFFTTVKNVAVALLVVAAVLAGRKLSQLKSLTKKDIALLTAIGVIGGAIPFYLFFTGLSMVPAINAAILQKTLIVWVALFAFFILKEKMTAGQVFGIATLFIANLLVGGFKGFQFSQGELMILVSSVFWGFEYVLAKKAINKIDSDLVVLARMGIGSLVLLGAVILSPAKNNINVTNSGLFWVGLSVVMLLGYVMSWYRALKFAPVTTVAGILVASTLVTNILTAVFVTKTFSTVLVVQSLLMVLGLTVLVKVAQSKPLVETVPNELN